MLNARPTFSACSSCGAAVHRDERSDHVCDEVWQLARGGLAAFEADLAAWLATADGRFAVWLAQRKPN